MSILIAVMMTVVLNPERVKRLLTEQGVDMAKKRIYFSLVVFSLMLVIGSIGCSSRPSDKQTRTDLQKWFDRRWPGTIHVVEYEAVSKERRGRKFVLEYQAKGQFIKDTSGCVPTCCGDVCFDKLVDGMRWIVKASDNPHVIRKGDLFATRGRNIYTKTVTGWSCEGP